MFYISCLLLMVEGWSKIQFGICVVNTRIKHCFPTFSCSLEEDFAAATSEGSIVASRCFISTDQAGLLWWEVIVNGEEVFSASFQSRGYTQRQIILGKHTTRHNNIKRHIKPEVHLNKQKAIFHSYYIHCKDGCIEVSLMKLSGSLLKNNITLGIYN